MGFLRTAYPSGCSSGLCHGNSVGYAIHKKPTHTGRYLSTASHCLLQVCYDHVSIWSHNLQQDRSSPWILMCHNHDSSQLLFPPGDINVVTKSDPRTTEAMRGVTQYMCLNIQVTTDYISRLLKKQNKHTTQKPIKKWYPTPDPSRTACPQKHVCPSFLLHVSDYTLPRFATKTH
jgi:hypothetical protein